MIKKPHLDLLKLFPTASLTLSSTWGKVFKIVAIIIIIIIRGINIVIPNQSFPYIMIIIKIYTG